MRDVLPAGLGLLALLAGVAGPAKAPTAADGLRSLRYERALRLPPGARGPVCAVLDATVMAHMASRSGDDLRVVASSPGGVLHAVPFALTESEAAPEADAAATVQDLHAAGDQLTFELAMPQRSYSQVELQLALAHFIATAQVWGRSGADAAWRPLGRFTLFDLDGHEAGPGRRGAARSTSLPLQETQDASLKIVLRLWTPQGRALPAGVPMVLGATVPPSREAQTLYTPVAQVPLRPQGAWSYGEVRLPAHVPVERASFVPAPQAPTEFTRHVTIAGRPATAGTGAAESVDGVIWRVRQRAVGAAPALDAEDLSVEAVLASNLREAGVVMVSVENGPGIAPILAAVTLEMRQRRVCFAAEQNASYSLRYGDASLTPGPDAPQSGGLAGSATPLLAELGAEQTPFGYGPLPTPARPHRARVGPLWVWLLVLLSAAWGIARHWLRGKEQRR